MLYFNRNAITNASLFISSVLLTIVFCEFFLRIIEITPGLKGRPFGFHYVRELILETGLVADSLGITHIDLKIKNKVADAIASDNNIWEIHFMSFPPNTMYILKELPIHYIKVMRNDSKLPLSKLYQNIINKPNNVLTSLDSAILNYIKSPINRNGFKSIEFENHSSDKKRILLIGDSFGWGYSASNLASGFGDILLTKGYEVYNSSIVGADPPQYLAVCSKYAQILHPDVVVVCLFLGNDVQYYNRPVSPYFTFEWPSNAGNLEPYPEGVPMSSPNEAYSLAYDWYHFPKDSGFLNQVASKSSVLTLLWQAVNQFYKLPDKSASLISWEKKSALIRLSKPATNSQMKEVKKICDSLNIPLAICIIPSNENRIKYVKDYEGLLEGQMFYEPHNFNKEDYNGNDVHFNNKGHIKFANFIDSVIQVVLHTNTN